MKKKLSSDYSPKKWNFNEKKISIKTDNSAHNSLNKFTCRYDVKIENDKNF